jgi:hypothetical protein
VLRRPAILGAGIALVALPFSFGGCGASDGPKAPASGADAQQVTDVITGYYAAQVKGDSQQACDYLTPARQTELTKAINGLNGGLGPKPPRQGFSSCADAVKFLLAVPAARLLARNVHVKSVAVSGDSATATATRTSDNGKSTANTDYVLTKANGGWKIAQGSGATTISPRSTNP